MSYYKLIVAGSRGWTNEDLMKEKLAEFYDKYIAKDQVVVIISGTARGADTMGEKIGRECDLHILRMPADWTTHGKSAGYRRNADMASVANGCLICWDGGSHGSKHMYDLAKKHELDTMLVTSIGQTI